MENGITYEKLMLRRLAAFEPGVPNTRGVCVVGWESPPEILSERSKWKDLKQSESVQAFDGKQH